MYEVVLSAEAVKRYKKQGKNTKKKINRSIDNLAKNPLYDSHVKKLWGSLEGNCRYKIGDIRIIYSINESSKKVLVKTIKSRGDVYK